MIKELLVKKINMFYSLLFIWNNRIKGAVSKQTLILLGFIAATLVISTPLILMTGCNMKNSLVLEMEAAHALPSKSWAESNKNVGLMIKNHFPKGMKISDALNEIHKNNFLITEGSREGARRWPDGEFKRHVADDIKVYIEQNYTESQVNYWASLTYWVSPLEKRKATITIETDGKVIVDSNGVIYSYTF